MGGGEKVAMTYIRPKWLPDLITLDDFQGDPIKYIEHIFNIFKKDFIDSNPNFKGRLVIHDDRVIDGKPACFQHITTEDDKVSGLRNNFNLRKSERICWIRPIIENWQDKSVVSIWENKRKIYRNTLLLLEQEKFLIVLINRKGSYLLNTCIYLERDHTLRKHLKERDEYLRKQKTP